MQEAGGMAITGSPKSSRGWVRLSQARDVAVAASAGTGTLPVTRDSGHHLPELHCSPLAPSGQSTTVLCPNPKLCVSSCCGQTLDLVR